MRRPYTQGKGDDLHRRSLYTVWKRSTPPPSAISFDASERLLCIVKRQRTSTPLQALVLLNDVQYVEAAASPGRAAAARRRRDDRRADHDGLSPADEPDAAADRTAAVRALLREGTRDLRGRRRSAAKVLAKSGETPPARTLDPVDVAAWTVVASTIMNTDEAVNKR